MELPEQGPSAQRRRLPAACPWRRSYAVQTSVVGTAVARQALPGQEPRNRRGRSRHLNSWLWSIAHDEATGPSLFGNRDWASDASEGSIKLMHTPGSRFCRRQWLERWGRRESGAQSATWVAATKLSRENFDVILRVGGRSHSMKQQTRTELVQRGG